MVDQLQELEQIIQIFFAEPITKLVWQSPTPQHGYVQQGH